MKHRGEVGQALEAAPEDGGTRLAIPVRPRKPPNLAIQRTAWDLRRLVDGTVEGLPFRLL